MKYKRTKTIQLLSLVMIFALSSLSCAFTSHQKFTSDSLHKEKDKYLSFYDDENGKSVHWEVNFNDEDITSVYRDGEKISNEDVDEYRTLINEKLDEIRFGLGKNKSRIKHFNFDIDEFHTDMEKFKNEFSNQFKFRYDFDEEEFNEQMEKLKEELKELKGLKIDLGFDSKEFKEQMSELGEQLNKHHFNFNIDDIDIDLEDLDIQMEKLNKELEEIDINLEDLDEELEKLDSFINELKEGLVCDEYLKNVDEDVEINISETEIVVNGKKLPDQLLDKYKALYKKHMGKDLSETSNILVH